ncbi:putative choline transport protein [Penicillium brasilianum]|uniref:Putative choline transport protein n=1 Tax=Penicillium brasilianum TaxID=104259 RepID=A0A1S9RJD8_PENBI|nr:putative choline transport protein [Penicillium brasilianum]
MSSSVQEIQDDAALLAALGYKQELKRQFSFFSMAANAVITASAWTAMIGSIITSIYNGGASGLLYAWIVDNFFFLFVALSMAELTSAMPTSAGVYHWSAALAGPRFAKPIGFLTGYFNVLGYTLGLASLYSVAGLEVTGLYQLWHPDYTSQPWHVFVVFVVLTWSAALFVQFGNKILPLYTKVGLFVNLGVWFVVVICIAALPKTHSTNSFVWKEYTNLTGWPTGVSFILGLVGPAFAIGTIDSSTHMAEEVPNPSKNIPKTILVQWFGSFSMGFIVLIAIFYSAGSLDAILNSQPNYPVASIMAQSFDNTNAAFGCGLIIFIASLTGQVGFQIVAVRCIWAFARDGALPFSDFFSKIDERSVMPARANILIAVITTALGALYVASTTAFNALVASYAVMSTTSFGFAIGVHLFTGRKRVAPGWFHLGDGPLGFFINGVAIVYILVSNVFFCLPYNRPPVTAKSMNYTSLVSYGMAILVVIWWFIGGKRSYKGPKLSGETQEALEGLGRPRVHGEQHVERGSVQLTEKEKS